ncbi:MAG: glycerophosphodiester phosphodiesterase family protein [Ktedonobacterales bacterium]
MPMDVNIAPVCYAHRGARGHAPENTLLAFEMAFDLGAEAIECDVQRSSDGELVILHDGTVNRTTNGRGAVATLDLATLRTLDAGARWRIPQCIPTLDETLALARRRGGALNLEIKGESVAESVGTAQAVAPVIEALSEDDPFRTGLLVSSFELPAVEEIKRRIPWLRVAALYGDREWRPQAMVDRALELQAEAIHPGVSLASAALVLLAHGAGLRVNVWTANRPATVRRLIGWGVDGLFSDYPERVIVERRRMLAGQKHAAPGM